MPTEKKYLEVFNDGSNDLYMRDKEAQEVIAAEVTVSDVNALPGTSSTLPVDVLTRIDDAITGAENVNVSMRGSIVTFTDRDGVSSAIDLLSSTEEVVRISIRSEVSGFDAEGLGINVYLNGSTTPSGTVTTDANGFTVVRVPNGYEYKLVFPVVQGCKEVAPVVHVARVSQRSVEVEYEEYVEDTEDVTFIVFTHSDIATKSATSDVTIRVTSDGTTTTYTTNAQGKVSFSEVIGTQYTVEVVPPSGYYMRNRRTTFERTAIASAWIQNISLWPYQSGLFIIDNNGGEYTLDEWKALVEASSRTNTDALYIKVATEQLCEYGTPFLIDVDMLANRSASSTVWSSSNDNISSLGYGTYEYDGLTATEIIIQEGQEQSLNIPAVIYCYGIVRSLAGATLQGFLPGIEQLSNLWSVRTEFDEIMAYVRPSGRTLSTWTTGKLSSTQANAGSIFLFSNTSSITEKWRTGSVAFPFFAY